VELNHDFVSIGGRIDSAPMWNGEDNWGTGTANVAGIEVAGVQTGYERMSPPPGSVTHSQLNKDHANTPQGQKTVNRIFPFGLIGTYYEIASGQNGASGGSYKDTGLAPRHTIRAWQCLFLDCAIYQLPPGPSATPASVAPARSAATMDIASTIAWVNSDPGMGAVAAFMDSIWAAADADSPSTYQYQLFDADGWPLPPNVSVTDLSRPVARVLDRAWPNPFAGHVSVRFYAPHAGHARLEVFDVSGRRLHTLVDQQLEPGWKDVIWDGKDASGRALPSGTYLCRLQAFGRSESCLLSLTR